MAVREGESAEEAFARQLENEKVILATVAAIEANKASEGRKDYDELVEEVLAGLSQGELENLGKELVDPSEEVVDSGSKPPLEVFKEANAIVDELLPEKSGFRRGETNLFAKKPKKAK